MKWIIGIDEVGRGPLAGPVTVCALMFPGSAFRSSESVFDSKQLSSRLRQKISRHLHLMRREGLIDFRIASVSERIIDRRGVVHAINLAIARSLESLGDQVTKSQILLDGGLRAPRHYKNQKTIIKGDARVPIIGLASIIAKVHRDRLMTRLGAKHLSWGFEKHKGYGTAAHYAALRKHGPSPIHRLSFLS